MIALSTTPPRDLDEVLAGVQALRHQLPRRDGVRYFNRLYIEVTSEVRRMVLAGGVRDPTFVVELDVNFAAAYFDAVLRAEGGPEAAPPAWRPLFEVRRQRNVAPIQLALAGMNAHINYDLPVQIARTAAAGGIRLDAETPQHHDFLQMTGVFERAEERAKRWLLTGLIHRLDRLFGRLDDAVAIWSILRAREAAWTNAVTLWHLRDDPARAQAFDDTLAHMTGAFGRGLALPSTIGLGRCLDMLRPR